MNLIVFLMLSLIPGFLWVWAFYRRDENEPEPKGMVLKIFLYGAISVIPAALLEGPFRVFLREGVGLPMLFFVSIFVVGLAEEGSKLLAVLIGAYNNREFSEVMDGIIYSVTAGLGFATAENVLYTFRFGPSVGLTRVIIAYLAHATFSGIAGFYLGLAKFSEQESNRLILTGLVIAMLLHGLYDFFILGELLSPIFVIFGVVLAYMALNRMIERANAVSPFKDE